MVAIFSVSVFAQCLIQLLIRGFYSLRDTKTPFFIGSLTVFLNVVTALLLTFVYHWGVLGLAMATTLSSLVQTFLLFFFLKQKIGGLGERELFLPLLKMGLTTLIMMLGLWMSMRFLDIILDTTRTINLLLLTGLSSSLGFLVYMMLAKLLKIKELISFWNILKRRGKWQEVLEQTTEVLDGSNKTPQTV